MHNFIKVKYITASTMYQIQKAFKDLDKYDRLSFDIETRSKYSNAEVQEAKDLLKDPTGMNHKDHILCKQVANSSGLSYPTLVVTTHFNISWSEEDSLVIIVNNFKIENYIWEWFITSNHHFIIHNFLFDAKVGYVRTGKLPKRYDDTMLMMKTLINNADDWLARTGLKVHMGEYYDPAWTLIDSYDNENYKEEKFLKYCAIDSSSTYKLYNLIIGEVNG